MGAVTEKPTPQEQQIARKSLPDFATALAKRKSGSAKIKIQDNGEFITIPQKALALLSTILETMAEGKGVSLLPSDAELSTQQAADLLHISRPHLIKLLDEGAIPFKKVGSHRRVLLDDVLTYESSLKENRKKQLAFLAEQAQELKMGYE